MTYIASAIPVMVGYGYNYTAATMIFAVGGVMGLVGSVVLGIVDQAIWYKKNLYYLFYIYHNWFCICLSDASRTGFLLAGRNCNLCGAGGFV